MSNFTPQQIEEFLQEFFDVAGTRQYTGARYVPIFGRAGSDTVEWDDLEPYEPLTVVMHQGVSYVSRRYVPSGIQVTDTAYWVETYRFNAQVEAYRQEVLSFQGQINEIHEDFVPFPDELTLPKYGTRGQVLTTLANGATKWEDPVVPSDEQAEAVITQWLSDHPEATTTVQDNSLTTAKYQDGSVTPAKTSELVMARRGVLPANTDMYSLYTYDSGWYGCGYAASETMQNLPEDFALPAPFAVSIEKDSFAGGFSTITLMGADFNVWYCLLRQNGTVYTTWKRMKIGPNSVGTNAISDGTITQEKLQSGFDNKIAISRGLLESGTDLYALYNAPSGWYGCNLNTTLTLSNLPGDFVPTPIRLKVENPSYAETFTTLELHDTTDNVWYCILKHNGDVYRTWHRPIAKPLNPTFLKNKAVAIIGDSISTHGNSGDFCNVPEMTITEEDVGVELNAYLTYFDVQNNLSLGGHTFTSAEIGMKVTFTPTLADVGKSIGMPDNYNPNTLNVWWNVMRQKFDFTPIPVCWSGASITSHEASSDTKKTSYAWHEAQIRKCGVRIPGTMLRNAPDAIFIYRGTNDFSHSPYTVLTPDYFDDYNWDYPVTDEVNGNYGYLEGLCLTIKKLRDAYPNAKIFLCTLNVFKRVNYSHFPTNNGINSLPEYNNAIREVADFMGCGVIEFDKDGITFENCYAEGYITDSAITPTHPNAKGHTVMGLKAITDIEAQYSRMS